MTLSEKLSMLHGSPDGRTECMDSPGCAYAACLQDPVRQVCSKSLDVFAAECEVGNIAPVERLRIPPVNMSLCSTAGPFSSGFCSS